MGHHHHAPSGDEKRNEDEIAYCPVMKGSTVLKADAEEEGLVRDYKGKRYYLCCDDCAPMFDADPDRYATA
ncbi:YHS domain-containing protein [Arthrobacter sp. TB 23]|uniref:YHS domain-containing protein n=1 Tax=Arthrobacter sp. TB 23 TaxID=494419 RepID=UPI00031DC3B3|nr:YHS domain-containing protein [Arthrobacter sp. TB 23]